MAWRKWTSKDGEIPEGTSVKLGNHFGTISGKIGKVVDTAAASSFSIVKVGNQKHSYHNSDLFVKTEVFGESMKNNKTVINEEIGTILSYAAIAILLSGNAYYLIKNALGKTGDIQSDVSTTKNKLTNVVDNVLGKVFPQWSRDKKINSIAKKLSKIPSVMEFVKNPNKPGIQKEIAKHLSKDELNYINDLKRGVIKQQQENKLREHIGKQIKILWAQLNEVDRKETIKEAFDIKSVMKNGTVLDSGFTHIYLKGRELKIVHNGNMGNSIERSVDPNLKSAGIPSVKELKQIYKVKKEKGSPDYSWTIIFDISNRLKEGEYKLKYDNLNMTEEVYNPAKEKRIKEGMGEYNNLPDSNSYHKVIKPFDIWVLTGSTHKGEHYGNAKIYTGDYQQTKAKVGDEIHNLAGGLFYVPKSGSPVKMKTDKPSDRGAFERGRDFNGFDLKKLQSIIDGSQKKVSYR